MSVCTGIFLPSLRISKRYEKRLVIQSMSRVVREWAGSGPHYRKMDTWQKAVCDVRQVWGPVEWIHWVGWGIWYISEPSKVQSPWTLKTCMAGVDRYRKPQNRYMSHYGEKCMAKCIGKNGLKMYGKNPLENVWEKSSWKCMGKNGLKMYGKNPLGNGRGKMAWPVANPQKR